MEFDSLAQFNEVMEQVKELTEALKIYGVYKKGIWK